MGVLWKKKNEEKLEKSFKNFEKEWYFGKILEKSLENLWEDLEKFAKNFTQKVENILKKEKLKISGNHVDILRKILKSVS